MQIAAMNIGEIQNKANEGEIGMNERKMSDIENVNSSDPVARKPMIDTTLYWNSTQKIDRLTTTFLSQKINNRCTTELHGMCGSWLSGIRGENQQFACPGLRRRGGRGAIPCRGQLPMAIGNLAKKDPFFSWNGSGVEKKRGIKLE